MSTHVTRRLIKGSSIILVLTFIATPLGYLIRILYSQSLSVEMYGLFYAVLALFTVLSAYNDLGFGYSVAYLVPKFIRENRFREAWSAYKYDQFIEIGSSIVISVLLIFLADFLSRYYFRVPEAKSLIYILTVYFIANSFLEALNKFFTGLQQEAYYSAMQPVRLFFTSLLSIIFFFFGSGNIETYAVAWVLAYIATCVIFQLLFYSKNKHIAQKLSWDKELFLKMSKYAFPTIITTTIFTLTTSIDIFFLTLFRGVNEVGVYNVALPLAAVSNIFISPLNALILPMVSENMENEKYKAKFLLSVILKIIPFIAFYFALFVVLFPSQTIRLLFGEKWVGLAEIPLMILISSYIFSSLASFLTSFVSGMGRVKERFYVTLLIAVFNFALSAPLIYFFGVTGAVVANAFIFAFSAILFGIIVNKEIKVNLPVAFYLKLLIVGGGLVFIVRFFQISPVSLIQYIFCGLAYSLIMLLVAFALKLISKDVLKFLKP